MKTYEQIAVKSELENTTDKYLVIGNHSEIIAAFQYLFQADQKALSMEIEGSKYGIIEVLKPGDISRGTMLAPVLTDDGEVEDISILFEE